MAAKRRTASRMESQSMGAASRRMSSSQAKERMQEERRERKMKCQVSRRSSPTFSPTWKRIVRIFRRMLSLAGSSSCN